MHKIFRNLNFSDTRKVPSMKCFGTVRQKNFWRIIAILPFSHAYSSSIPEIFWNTGFTYEIFRLCETKKSQLKIVIAPPSYALHVSIPETFWNTEGFLYEMFLHCQTKKSRRNIVIPPPSYAKKLFETENFLKHRRVPLRSFLVLWAFGTPSFA